MPSRLPSLHFTVVLEGTWQLDDSVALQHHAPEAIARTHLREHIGRVLRRHTVHALPAAQDAVNAVIARPLCPEQGLLVHGTAHLTLSDEDRATADEHLRRSRQGDLEQEETRQRLAFLRSVLSDPSQRMVWWVDRFPGQIKELAAVDSALGSLTPPPADAHTTVQDEAARFVDRLFAEMHTPQQREVFVRALARTVEALASIDLQAAATRWLSARTDEPGADTE
jgi:hypothetical protein